MKKYRNFLKRNIFYSLAGGFVFLFGVCLLAFGLFLSAFSLWANGKTVDESLLPEGKNVPVFFDMSGNQIEYKTDDYLSPDEIPEDLKNAFVALEDKRFYSHDGIDTYRILGATVKNLKSGRIVEGASTITQQLVKNTHLTAEKSISRKLNEMAIAMKIEEEYSKDEILAMYLSVIYFGSGAYGVKEASKLYFGCTPENLSTAQCATLAGIVKNPKRYSPINDVNSSVLRRNLVLSVMKNEGYLNDNEYKNAVNEKLVVAKSVEKNHDFYIERAVDELTKKLNITKYQLDNSGYKIYLNMDSALQSALECESGDVRNYKYENTNNETIVLNNSNGKIIAHYSSTGYEVRRQAGSTLKPLVVYAPALQENIIDLATPITDEITTFGDWTPKNFNDVYYGETTVREAIMKSMNTVAVKVGTYIGENKMYEYGKNFGLNLSNSDKNLTLSLGATENGSTPRELASAYSTFANGGEKLTPSYINYVTLNGKKVYPNEVKSTKIIDDDVSYLVTDALIDTVLDGTAKTLSTLPYSVAGKTGTTSRDAWCVAYTRDHTVAVWHEGEEVGGGHPTMHAKRILESVYKNSRPSNFVKPDGIIEKSVDVYSTLKNKSVTFASGNTPRKFTKKELFRTSTAENNNKSLFDKAKADFEIYASEGKVKIIMRAEEIYDYILTRDDVFGEKTIAYLPSNIASFTSDGKRISTENRTIYSDGILKEYSDGIITVTIFDMPISLGSPVKYALTVSIINENSQNKVLGKTEKSVFAD